MDNSEWWDLRDAAGVQTGEVFLRGAPGWPGGRYHLIVATCVFRDDGKVLQTQRAPGKEFERGWEFPGGSALAGETSRFAAGRELEEETGIAVPPSDLTLVGRFIEESALLDFYVAAAPPHHQLRLQVSEVMAADWVSYTEVERRISARLMALPWNARLKMLWPEATAAMNAAR
ncbi:NUDIX hydrolase [Leifsonia shinshuensis]|uniref:NUDIX hydrolase n=1 Tax=Leifsonia shinshuensis TaxID=150026 RepID=UPI00286396BD|nr:NUDIX hydrolase [Leifsonia shinshuensis]MDR6971572.1 8-oxo-dGTP pyrophosphatase MutT (NUDIX family) [Leifsonia shinshuensis]